MTSIVWYAVAATAEIAGCLPSGVPRSLRLYPDACGAATIFWGSRGRYKDRSRAGGGRKRSLEVGHKVSRIFQSDLKADNRAAIIAPGDGPVAEIYMHGKAFITAPRISQAEDLQGIEKSMSLLLVATIEDDRENTGGAGKIAFPERMAGMAFEGGMQDLCNARLLFEPMSDMQGVLLVAFKPNAHRAQATQDLISVVGADAYAKRTISFQQLRPAALIC